MQGLRIKNKRTASHSKALKTISLMVAVAVLSIIYIAQHMAIIRIGFNISEKEIQYQELLDEKARLESKVAVLESVGNIRELLREKKISLRPQSRSQVIVIGGVG